MKVTALDRLETFLQRNKKRQEQPRRAARQLQVSAAFPAYSFAEVLRQYMTEGGAAK